MLEPVKKSRLYEHVVKQIKDLIASGKLKPGDHLPSEKELSEQLKISRPSIREALRALETMGHIESRVGAGGGSFVKQLTMDDLLEPLGKILLTHKKSILELHEARLMLESEAAGLAAQRRNAEDLAEMEQSLSMMEEEIEKGERGFRGDKAFHSAIAKATHNDVLATLMTMFEDLQNELREATLSSPGQPSRSLEDHRAVHRAVSDGDRTGAVNSMRAHLLKARQSLEREL